MFELDAAVEFLAKLLEDIFDEGLVFRTESFIKMIFHDSAGPKVKFIVGADLKGYEKEAGSCQQQHLLCWEIKSYQKLTIQNILLSTFFILLILLLLLLSPAGARHNSPCQGLLVTCEQLQMCVETFGRSSEEDDKSLQ